MLNYTLHSLIINCNCLFSITSESSRTKKIPLRAQLKIAWKDAKIREKTKHDFSPEACKDKAKKNSIKFVCVLYDKSIDMMPLTMSNVVI